MANAGWIAGWVALAMLGCDVALAQPTAGTGEVYTCIDRNGRRLTADRPIPECSDREQRVLDSTGAERRRLGPTLTEHERAALEAQRRKEALERARVAAERRAERVLVARYPDEAAHQLERENALSQVDELIAVAQRRIAELRASRKPLEQELEFYKGDMAKAPANLQRQFAENDQDIAQQERFIVTQHKDKERINARFDAELAKLRVLWAQQRAAQEKVAPPPSATN